MGAPESFGSEAENQGSTGLHKRQILSQNSGVCMEELVDGPMLHLGSGKRIWDKWMNVDFDERADIQCDLKKLPFDDNYADVAVSVHVIEHFYQWDVQDILLEWKRVLKTGGKLVLELPCMDKVLNHMHHCMQNKLPIYPGMGWFVFWGDPRYKDPHMGHKWGYTKHMIQEALESAGFRDVAFEEPRYHFKMRDMRVIGFK